MKKQINMVKGSSLDAKGDINQGSNHLNINLSGVLLLILIIVLLFFGGLYWYLSRSDKSKNTLRTKEQLETISSFPIVNEKTVELKIISGMVIGKQDSYCLPLSDVCIEFKDTSVWTNNDGFFNRVIPKSSLEQEELLIIKKNYQSKSEFVDFSKQNFKQILIELEPVETKGTGK